MNRVITNSKYECSGCGACVAICPKHCLKLEKDELGFSVPVLREGIDCVDCGHCKRVCVQQNKRCNEPQIQDSLVFYCQNLNKEELKESSSGGYLSILARWILKQRGKVWGVTSTPNGHVKFVCIENVSDLYRIRGSKYVEVQTPLDYKKVRAQLELGVWIMVSGLPCQIRALYNFLGKKTYPNLLLVDLLCYGIQSPKMWELYMADINPSHKKIKQIFMRNKQHSWYDYSMNITYQDGTSYRKTRWHDNWLLSYSRTVFNRESCTCCESKKFPRISDFTIGDFWGIETYGLSYSKINKKEGVSIVYAHTPVAKQIVSEVSTEVISKNIESNLVKKISRKNSLSVPFHRHRDDFIKMAFSESFHSAREKYLESGVWFRFKKRYRIFKNKLKNMIRQHNNNDIV